MIRFKVFPEPKRKAFFHVRIFDSIKTMRASAARHGCLSGGIDGEPVTKWRWAALSHGHTVLDFKKPRPMAYDGVTGARRTPELGIMWFSFELLNAEIVSHECTHSVLRWARRVRIKIWPKGMSQEERFCYAQGEMVGQFWREVYRRAPRRYLRVKGRVSR